MTRPTKSPSARAAATRRAPQRAAPRGHLRTHGTPPGTAGGGGPPALATPAPKQRGRKRRTEPILVEREDGTKEEVSPQVYRRLRRRVTNRLSARRMRQKRAEERDAIAAEARLGGPVMLCAAWRGVR